MIGELVRVPTIEALHESAADLFTSAAVEAVAERGTFMVALAGGKTPQAMYELIGSRAPWRLMIPWDRVQCFWGDERHVPPDHPDSNYGMTRRALLDHVPIDPRHVWRIKGEYPNASDAAAEYERDLRIAFGLAADECPRFDLILLGLGADGHTASLFPHSAALAEPRRLVVANYVEAFATERLTVTVPVLNNAAQVLFLVQGADKAPALQAVLEGASRPEHYPAQLVRPSNGRLRWLVDPTAAALLSSSER